MAARIVLVPLSGQASGEFQRNGAMMNTVKYIAAGLVFAAINPALAQVQLPNGETTRPGVVQLFNFWGQDNGDGSGIVVGSAHQAPSGPYNIYIYTGNQPQDFIWGEVHWILPLYLLLQYKTNAPQVWQQFIVILLTMVRGRMFIFKRL